MSETGIAKLVEKRIIDELETHTATVYDEGYRWHLGASKIGSECRRELWYSFRWVSGEKFNGRMQRLFNRGHREEERHVEWLRGMGFDVWNRDTTITKPDGTHPQFRIKNQCKGHFGGSLDGIVGLPARYRIRDYLVLESKTNGTGATFNKILDEGVAKGKPQHYIQNSIYGFDYGLDHMLYMCANKNDDDLAIKVEKLDFNLAQQMINKAETIIFSQEPPPRLSENPTFFQCKSLCTFKEVCHFGKPIERNCRSCMKCAPVDAGEFYCSQWDAVIPRDAVPKGCDEWVSILPPERKPVTEEKPVIIVGKPKKLSKNELLQLNNDIPY